MLVLRTPGQLVLLLHPNVQMFKPSIRINRVSACRSISPMNKVGKDMVTVAMVIDY